METDYCKTSYPVISLTIITRIIAAIAAFLVILQVVFILKDASWTLVSDDFDFLAHTVSGRPFMPSDNMFSGRFTPLAFIEYNLLIPFGDCPYAYYSWLCIKYLISLMLFFLIQREVFNLTDLKRLSRDCKLLVLYTSTIVFLLLPGFFTVFLDVVYYENTSIPISLILIYTIISVFKRPSILKMFVALVLLNTLIYLKETYVIFGLSFLLMVLFHAQDGTQSVAYRLAIPALFSIVIYLIVYVLLVGRQTEVFYFEKTDVDLLTGILWMIFLNPTFMSTLTCLTFLVIVARNSFTGTKFVTVSALTVCAFFLVTGMYAMSYQMSIVYPFLFFTAQIELTPLIKRNPLALKVFIPLLTVLIMFSGLILIETSRPHIIARGQHFSSLEIINEHRVRDNSLIYIYNGNLAEFRKLQLGVTLEFILNGSARLDSHEKNIKKIESVSDIIDSRNAILFFPNNSAQPSGGFESHDIDTIIGIADFDYNAIVLNKN